MSDIQLRLIGILIRGRASDANKLPFNPLIGELNGRDDTGIRNPARYSFPYESSIIIRLQFHVPISFAPAQDINPLLAVSPAGAHEPCN